MCIEDVFNGLDNSSFLSVVNTIPGQAQTSLDIEPLTINLTRLNGVFVEMVYRPRDTPLVKVFSAGSFKVVYGVNVLIEQGFEQFKLWTQIEPPRKAMAQSVMNAY